MYDRSLLFEKLLQIDEALDRIERRFSSITTVDYFLDSEKGLDMLDSIAMMLIVISVKISKRLIRTQKAHFSWTIKISTGQV